MPGLGSNRSDRLDVSSAEVLGSGFLLRRPPRICPGGQRKSEREKASLAQVPKGPSDLGGHPSQTNLGGTPHGHYETESSRLDLGCSSCDCFQDQASTVVPFPHGSTRLGSGLVSRTLYRVTFGTSPNQLRVGGQETARSGAMLST